MILTHSDVDRLVDQELRFKCALMERSSLTPAATPLERGRAMGDLFCEDSVWPAMTEKQLVWAIGELCGRARDTQDLTVSQAVAMSCLYSLLGTYGRVQTVEMGIHGQCLMAIDDVFPLQHIPGLDAEFVSNHLKGRDPGARKWQLRAIAQTSRCRPAIARHLYEGVMLDCLIVAENETQDVINEARQGDRGVGTRGDVRALLEYATDLPDFLDGVLPVWGTRVKDMIETDLILGANMSSCMARSLWLMSVMGYTLPAQPPDVTRPWIDGWDVRKRKGWACNEMDEMGMRLLRRVTLKATAHDNPPAAQAAIRRL